MPYLRYVYWESLISIGQNSACITSWNQLLYILWYSGNRIDAPMNPRLCTIDDRSIWRQFVVTVACWLELSPSSVSWAALTTQWTFSHRRTATHNHSHEQLRHEHMNTPALNIFLRREATVSIIYVICLHVYIFFGAQLFSVSQALDVPTVNFIGFEIVLLIQFTLWHFAYYYHFYYYYYYYFYFSFQ